MKYLFLLSVFICFGALGQYQKVLGVNTTNNYAYAVTSDDAGNVYMGATSNQSGWLIKLNPEGDVLWSKTISDVPDHAIDISSIEVLGDTVFGCGWLKTGTTINGSMYFKANATTGAVYWLKADPSNKSYFSSMKYYNGRYFLTGSVINGNNNYDGKVLCVNTATGDMVWQSQGMGIEFSSFNNDYIDDFMSSTDMVDGKMYITGRSYVNGNVINMRPLLIGIDESGLIFCKKHLMYDPQNTAGIKRIYGMQIDYTTGQDSLVVGWFGDPVCSGSCNNYLSGLIKTDLQGNASFTKVYDIQGHAYEMLTEMVVTDEAYYFFGTLNQGQSNPRNYITKVSRNGDFIKAKLISNGTNNLTSFYGTINVGGRASYNNGMLYFTSKMYQSNATNSTIVLHAFDEELSDLQNCFTSQNLTAIVSNCGNFVADLDIAPKSTSNNHVNYQIVTDHNYVDNCAGIIIDTSTYILDNVTHIVASSPQIASPSFEWSNGSTSNETTFTEDTLILKITNPTNCCFEIDTFVVIPCTITVDLGNDTTLCENETLVLNAPAGFSYLWSDNSSGNQLVVSNPGTYWLEASNSTCSARDSIVVAYQNPPSVDLGNDTTLCNDQLISWSFSNPGFTYLWQDNSTGNSFTAQASGLYWLEVDNGCSFRDSIQITYLNAPQPDLGSDTTLCENETLVLNAPAGFSYLWNDNSNGNQLVVSNPGTYWLEASNSTCSARDSIVVAYQNPPSVDLGNDTTLCNDQLISWSFSNPGFTYLWQDNSTGNSFTAQASGLYWLEVDNGCSFRDSIQITYLNAPQPELGNDTTLCENETLVLNAPAGFSYLWSDNSNGNQLVVSNPGTYWLEASNSTCSARDSIEVAYQNPPSVDLGNDTTLCENEILVIHAVSSPNVSYLWNTNSTSEEITVNQAGIYWVEVSVSGCTARDSMELGYQPSPQIDLGDDTTLCTPDVLLLSLPGSFSTYLWSDNSTGNSINVSEEGEYSVEAGMSGCVSRDSIYVSFIERFSIQTDTTVCLDDQVLLPANYPAGTYLWGDGTDLPYLQVSEPGSYELQFFNACGANEVVFDVDFTNCDCYLYIPNTFTPDANEHNPRFEVVHECEFKSFHLQVFNRWGELIFESYDPGVGWDGTYAGFGLVQDDVYVWKLNYVDNITLKSTNRVGHVSVIK